MRRDLALAAEVQKKLLPAEPPAEAFAQFEATTLPGRRIGGDYYDFIEAGDHRGGIAIADVSGKGIAAALIMAVAQASLRIVTADGDVPPAQLAARLNDFLCRSTPPSKYATFFYADVDSRGRKLRYVNVGHNPPYLFRRAAAVSTGVPASDAGVVASPDGLMAGAAVAHPAGTGDVVIQELSTGGIVVGMFPGVEYEEGKVELQPGDLLVAFTDGVSEALNPGGEESGEERLKDVVRVALGLPASAIVERVSTALAGVDRRRRAARRSHRGGDEGR